MRRCPSPTGGLDGRCCEFRAGVDFVSPAEFTSKGGGAHPEVQRFAAPVPHIAGCCTCRYSLLRGFSFSIGCQQIAFGAQIRKIRSLTWHKQRKAGTSHLKRPREGGPSHSWSRTETFVRSGLLSSVSGRQSFLVCCRSSAE